MERRALKIESKQEVETRICHNLLSNVFMLLPRCGLGGLGEVGRSCVNEFEGTQSYTYKSSKLVS
jgi:hypothetical protein